LLDEALEAGAGGHYQSFAIELDGEVAGWICLGPTPCSLGAWDVYWLGVAAEQQGKGLGQALLRHAERLINKRGGYLSVIETSGSPGYVSTRGFYLKAGYHEAARLPDFYAPGDDRIIYTKDLRQP
jgi:ribosomal protein S18 acetylase RimI-like enzyme